MAGCGSCCAKAIIIMINILFFLIGLAFIAGGAIFFVGKDLIGGILEGAFEAVTAAQNGSMTGDGEVGEIAAEFLELFQPLFIALIVVGCVMVITAILAMCGSCCSVNCMLITYVIIVLVVFAAHVALFICLMVGAFSGEMKKSLQKSIDEKFVGIKDQGAYSVGWNVIMSEYECCGLENYKDFDNAQKWNKYPDGGSTELVTPVACCMMVDGEIPEDYTCAQTPSDLNNNWNKGCWEAVNERLVNEQKNVVIGVNCAILGFELILAALTLCIIFQNRKEHNM